MPLIYISVFTRLSNVNCALLHQIQIPLLIACTGKITQIPWDLSTGININPHHRNVLSSFASFVYCLHTTNLFSQHAYFSYTRGDAMFHECRFSYRQMLHACLSLRLLWHLHGNLKYFISPPDADRLRVHSTILNHSPGNCKFYLSYHITSCSGNVEEITIDVT